MVPCPICGADYAEDQLERHVNQCLDKQETGGVLSLLGSQSKKPPVKRKLRDSSLTSELLAKRRSFRESSPPEKEKQESTPDRRSEEPIHSTSSPKSSPIKKRSPPNLSPRKNPPNINEIKPQLQKPDHVAVKEKELPPGTPLAHRLRPTSLDDYLGHEKLLGPNGIIRKLIKADPIPSFILWGPPGVGKTTLARIISEMSTHKFVELSGADSTTKKLKEVFATVDNEFKLTGRRTILFLDEIHRFNKAVQDVLLPVIERGKITIIGATTENPSFTLNNALLSRCHVFTLDSISTQTMKQILVRALFLVNRDRSKRYQLNMLALNDEVLEYLADVAKGDSRIALNLLESMNAYFTGDEYKMKGDKTGAVVVTSEVLKKEVFSSRHIHHMYDRQGDGHYDAISAFHKSVRGSDPDAAMFYLVKMLSGGEDPLFIARRMIVIASEDIGLRDSSCLPFAVACKDAIEFIGMPEGEITLAHCAMKLARAPKSTKSYRALRSTQAFLTENPELASVPIPLHLRNAPTGLMKKLGYGEDYKYNPKYENGKIAQEFLPPEVAGKFPKVNESRHLGVARDPQVETDVYEQAAEADEEYAMFKQYQKRHFREEYLRSVNGKAVEEEGDEKEIEAVSDDNEVNEVITENDDDDEMATELDEGAENSSIRYDDGAIFFPQEF